MAEPTEMFTVRANNSRKKNDEKENRNELRELERMRCVSYSVMY